MDLMGTDVIITVNGIQLKIQRKKKKMCRVNSLKMLTKQIPVTKQRLYTPHKSVKGDKFHITKSHFP